MNQVRRSLASLACGALLVTSVSLGPETRAAAPNRASPAATPATEAVLYEAEPADGFADWQLVAGWA